MATTKQLQDYIVNAKNAGMSEIEIQNALIAAGWKLPAITNAIDSIHHPNVKGTRKNFIIITTIITFLLVSVAGYYIYRHTIRDESRLDQPIETANSIIAYVESTPDHIYSNVVFYDTLKKATLLPDAAITADDNSIFLLGTWSPNGQHLPILAFSGPGTDNQIINLYLFDAQSQSAKRIYRSVRNDDNFVWANPSFDFVSGWIDNSRLVVQSNHDTSQNIATLTYFTLDGAIDTVEQPFIIKTASNLLTHTISLDVDTQIQTVTVAGKALGFTPEGTIVGVVDEKLGVLKKPIGKSFEFSDAGNIEADQTMTDLENQMKAYEDQGMSQEELSKIALDFWEPKGETGLDFYGLDTGEIEQTIALTEGTWQTISILIHPTQQLLVAHQTDKGLLPSKERFITINPSDNQPISVLFENNLVREHDQNFSNRLLFQGRSFSLSGDGNWIIGERGSIVNDPQNSFVFMRNIKTGEEVAICSSYCSNIRVHYPQALQRRY